MDDLLKFSRTVASDLHAALERLVAEKRRGVVTIHAHVLDGKLDRWTVGTETQNKWGSPLSAIELTASRR